jgi:hypothetical protein
MQKKIDFHLRAERDCRTCEGVASELIIYLVLNRLSKELEYNPKKDQISLKVMIQNNTLKTTASDKRI